MAKQPKRERIPKPLGGMNNLRREATEQEQQGTDENGTDLRGKKDEMSGRAYYRFKMME
jgi:hypothetical protein